MELPASPSRTSPDGEVRQRLRRELEPVVAMLRPLVGPGALRVVVPIEVLGALTGDASGSTPLELSPTLAVVARIGTSDVLLPAGPGVGIAVAAGASSEALARGAAVAAIATTTVATLAELVTANALVRDLRELSEHDPLTGLGNRRYLDRALAYEIGRRRRYERALSVAMLDLDRFKRVNDVHGHDGGDRLLVAVADLLRSTLRGADVAVRYGGEEFAVILPETAGEHAAIVAERIRGRMAALDVGGIRVTTSIGVASVEGRWEGDASSLVRAADQALYRAKREGRDRVVHADVAEGSMDSSPRIESPRLRGR